MISIKNDVFNPVLLTFSKRNYDVARNLEEMNRSGITKTDYICEAIRFYYSHKHDRQTPTYIDDEELDRKVKELVYKYLHGFTIEPKIANTFNVSGINKSDLEDD